MTQEVKTNPKAFFSFANTKRKMKHPVPPLQVDGKTVNDNEVMANGWSANASNGGHACFASLDI